MTQSNATPSNKYTITIRGKRSNDELISEPRSVVHLIAKMDTQYNCILLPSTIPLSSSQAWVFSQTRGRCVNEIVTLSDVDVRDARHCFVYGDGLRIGGYETVNIRSTSAVCGVGDWNCLMVDGEGAGAQDCESRLVVVVRKWSEVRGGWEAWKRNSVNCIHGAWEPSGILLHLQGWSA